MARKIYHLYSNAAIIDPTLAVEIGTGYLVLVAGTAGNVSGLEYYDTEGGTLEDSLDEIKTQSQLLTAYYSETRVYYHLPESVLIPATQFSASLASEYIELVFGNRANTRVNVENINVSPAIVNVYQSNDQWHEIITRNFRAVTQRHLYSTLIENVLAQNKNLAVIFNKHYMTVVAANNNQLQLVRQFSYNKEADILYHLLNVCKQVQLDTASITLHVAGFLDAAAATLLQKYFRVQAETVPQSQLDIEGIQKYPLHYFTPFINLLS